MARAILKVASCITIEHLVRITQCSTLPTWTARERLYTLTTAMSGSLLMKIGASTALNFSVKLRLNKIKAPLLH